MKKFTLDKLPRRVLAGLEVEKAFMASGVVIAAERFQVFRILQGKKLNSAAIERRLGIHRRYLACFLDTLVSLGLLRKQADLYYNSALAEKYFIQERSIYWTRQFSRECVEDFEAFTAIERLLRSGKSWNTVHGKKRQGYVELMKKDPGRAENFTRMLYYYHQEDAEILARYLDLSKHRAVLDLGGGSGVMSIALVKKNPHLRACVLDIEAVCRIAGQIVKRENLAHKISALAGDMYEQLPAGYDVIICCDIGSISKSLLRTIYKSLPHKGMVALVDRFQSKDRTEPLDNILYQFIGHTFGIETYKEVIDALRACGFRRVKSHKLHGHLRAISGIKPRTN
jgi:tRNA A58 N-methylase Trm61